MSRCKWLVLVGMFWAGQALAITVDGTLDAGYGAAVAVQSVQTGFGDVTSIAAPNGSELDAAYAKFESGRLYLMLTGNQEPNFNKLEIYFDSVAGGENVLTSTVKYDYSGDGGTTWNSQNQGGMVFDAGFAADYHMFSRWGGTATPGVPGPFEVDFVNRQGGANAMVPGSAEATAAPVGLIASGVVLAGDVGPNASGTALTQNLEFAMNGNNIAGVAGCGGGGCVAADQTAAAAVTTGMEFSIALADLGNPAGGSTIRIAAVISNSDHSYLSNQSLGSFTAPQQNPGGNGNNPGDGFNGGGYTGTMAGMDFNNYAGDQYFSLTVPMVAGVPGDYNGDTKVNALDYTLWRNHLGEPTEANINNNGNGGDIGPGDFDFWKLHYGDGGGPGAGGVATPEPTSALILLVGSILAGATLRRRG